MDIKKTVLNIVGICLIAYGYHLLGVPPDTSTDIVITRVKHGELAIFIGATCFAIGLFRKS